MKNFECLICKETTVKKDNSFFPFCSDRCKLIDLGAWLDGMYSVKEDTSQDTETEI